MHGNDFSEPLRFRSCSRAAACHSWGLLLLSNMAKCGGMGNLAKFCRTPSSALALMRSRSNWWSSASQDDRCGSINDAIVESAKRPPESDLLGPADTARPTAV